MKCNASTLAGIFFVLLGLGVCWLIPSQITVLDIYSDELSPRFFPYACVCLVIFFALATIAAGFAEPSGCALSQRGRQALSMVFRVTLYTVVCLWAIQYLGLIFAVSLLVVALCAALGVRSPRLLALVGIGWGVSVYVLFEVVFSFTLPKGLF